MARLSSHGVRVLIRRGVWCAAALVLLACAPSALAAPKTLQGAAYEQMKTFMQAFDKDGFAEVVDLGAAKTYKATLAGLTLEVDPMLKGVAQYDPKTKTLTFSKDPRKLTGAAKVAMGETVWHEVTHAIEDAHGDIGYFDNEAYAERNIDYMTYVARSALPWLEQLEKQAKKGASVEKLKALWQKYLKAMDAAGKLPSTTQYPPDLGLMKTWFGFAAAPADIKAAYLSGKALPGKQGANLRKALAAGFKPEDWAGVWSTWNMWGDLTLTVSGSSVTGVWQYSADADQFQGTISPDGGTMTGSWLEDTNLWAGPEHYVYVFAVQLSNEPPDSWTFSGYFHNESNSTQTPWEAWRQ
jgi:hypothetical protein